LPENEVIKITTQTVQKLEQASESRTAKCSHCGSTNVYGMSRVVGYFSKINNWNASKRAELKSRQKGNYKI
jgi:ribonucleoside-triphosphate reductase